MSGSLAVHSMFVFICVWVLWFSDYRDYRDRSSRLYIGIIEIRCDLSRLTTVVRVHVCVHVYVLCVYVIILLT